MDTNQSFIPFHLPSIGSEEIDEVTKVLMSGWLTTGPRTHQFERDFAAYVDVPHALAISSGTAAMHVALVALGIGPGDEVITTPLTFCATVHAIQQAGAKAVLADVGEDGNIDPNSIANSITPKTRAILPVHLGGLPCDMNSIWKLAREHGLFVIEDAAHAIGSKYCGRQIGAGSPDRRMNSDAVAFSFYATKNLTTGEGGMVTAHDQTLVDRMKVLCLHGISKDAWNRYAEQGNWYYEVSEGGFKYNLSDVQGAIGIHQLRKQEQFIEARTQIAQKYNDTFGDLSEVELPPASPSCRHNWHLYPIRLNLEKLDIDRAAFMRELRARAIGASVHFIPIPLHSHFQGKDGLDASLCPKALELYPRLVSLPLYPAMTVEQVDRVIQGVVDVVRRHRTSKMLAFSEMA